MSNGDHRLKSAMDDLSKLKTHGDLGRAIGNAEAESKQLFDAITSNLPEKFSALAMCMASIDLLCATAFRSIDEVTQIAMREGHSLEEAQNRATRSMMGIVESLIAARLRQELAARDLSVCDCPKCRAERESAGTSPPKHKVH